MEPYAGKGDRMHDMCNPAQDTSRMGTAVVVAVMIIQALYGSITMRQKNKGPSSMDCRERGFHARGGYPTRYTSRMGTARVKQEEADTRIIVRQCQGQHII